MTVPFTVCTVRAIRYEAYRVLSRYCSTSTARACCAGSCHTFSGECRTLGPGSRVASEWPTTAVPAGLSSAPQPTTVAAHAQSTHGQNCRKRVFISRLLPRGEPRTTLHVSDGDTPCQSK